MKLQKKENERMSDKYILDGHEVKEVGLMEWAKWYETADRHVDKTKIGDVEVSTVFLGLNHNYGDGAPLLFETMIFGGMHDREMKRYATWEEAEAGHKEMVAKAKE